jgi:hypothetical protein
MGFLFGNETTPHAIVKLSLWVYPLCNMLEQKKMAAVMWLPWGLAVGDPIRGARSRG